jgi:hypothetical protein
MIQHPRKAKRNNVLKLLGLLLLFLALLCMVLQYSGSSYNCNAVKDKITDIMSGVRDRVMHPMEALNKVRDHMKEAFDKFKALGPVVTAMAAMGGFKNKLGGLFIAPVKLFKKTDTFGQVKEKITENDQFRARRDYLLGLITTSQGTKADTEPIGDSFATVPDINKYIE